MLNRTQKIGLVCALVHLLGFVVLSVWVKNSAAAQAPLVLVPVAIVDFPVSLLYLAGRWYSTWYDKLGDTFLAQILYGPNVIDGLLGTFWWYFLPRLVTPKRYGGIWGKIGSPGTE